MQYPALTKMIEAEDALDTVLPIRKLEEAPSTELITAAKKWSETVWAQAEELRPMKLSKEQVALALQLSKNAVFVCGVHRSGTTLLRDMLDGHPSLVVLPSEGTYYTNQEAKLRFMPEKEWAAHLGREWLRRMVNPINQPPYWLLGRSTEQGSPYVDFARYVLAWWEVVPHEPGTQWPHMAIVLAYASCTGKLGAGFWVDKTPTNERFLKRIWQELPSAKIIHMVRDPVATISSHKKMDPSFSLRTTLRYLRNSFHVAAQQSLMRDPRFLLLRYEDLCDEQQKTTSEVATFLNIESLDIMKQTSVAGIPSWANSSFNKQAQAGMILKAQRHPQNQSLNGLEQKAVAAYLRKLAAKHKYYLERVSFLSKLYVMIKFRLFI